MDWITWVSVIGIFLYALKKIDDDNRRLIIKNNLTEIKLNKLKHAFEVERLKNNGSLTDGYLTRLTNDLTEENQYITDENKLLESKIKKFWNF